jgi:hypothetical protein
VVNWSDPQSGFNSNEIELGIRVFGINLSYWLVGKLLGVWRNELVQLIWSLGRSSENCH